MGPLSPQRNVRGAKSRTGQQPHSCPDAAEAVLRVHESHNTALQQWAGQALQSRVSVYCPTTATVKSIISICMNRIHRGTGDLPDRITVRKLAGISIFMSKINFFKYITQTSLQIGRHCILTKYTEILGFTATLKMYNWRETYSQKKPA